MTDKQIINTCEFFNICESACGGTLEDTEMCSCYELHKQLDQAIAQREAFWAMYKTKHGDLADRYEKLKAENEDLENQLEREKERFEKQDKFAAMFIQELKNEKSSLVNEYLKKIGQLQSDNEELKRCYKNNSALLDFEETNTTKLVNKVMKLEKTLAEIKDVLNFYANSKIGEQQENGTYRVRLDEQYSTFYAHVPYFEYDPRPAKQALCKINEVENGI